MSWKGRVKKAIANCGGDVGVWVPGVNDRRLIKDRSHTEGSHSTSLSFLTVESA